MDTTSNRAHVRLNISNQLKLQSQTQGDFFDQKSRVSFDSPVSERGSNRLKNKPLAISSSNPLLISGPSSFISPATYQLGQLLSNTPMQKFQKSNISPNKLPPTKRLWTPKIKGDLDPKLLKRSESAQKKALQKLPIQCRNGRQSMCMPSKNYQTQTMSHNILPLVQQYERRASKSPITVDEHHLNFNPQASRIQLHDQEDLKHSNQQLKISYNQVQEENLKLKTMNAQLEQLVQQLYKDLNFQKQEIQEIYAGKPASAHFLQSSIAQGLKRQLRQERISKKALTTELQGIKKSQKESTISELEAQLDLYQQELIRLRTLLEQQLKRGQKNVVQLAKNQMEIFKLNYQEESKQVSDRQKNKILEQAAIIEKLQKQLLNKKDQSKRDSSANECEITKKSAAEYKQQLKAQKAKVQVLTKQLEEVRPKVANYEQIFKQNEQLSQQVSDLTTLCTKYERLINSVNQRQNSRSHITLPQISDRVELRRQSFSGINNVLEDSPRDDREEIAMLLRPSSPFKGAGSANVSRQLTTQFMDEQVFLQVPQSFVKSNKSKQSDEVKEKPFIQILKPPFADEPLTNYELMVNGIKIFKSIHDYSAFLPSTGDKQPEQLYFIYEKQIKELRNKIRVTKVQSTLLQQVYQDRQIKFKSTNLVEQTHEIVSRWSQFTSDEIQVCTLVHNIMLPCIREDLMIDLNMLKEMIEMQMSQQSEEEWLSQQKQAESQQIKPDSDEQIAQVIVEEINIEEEEKYLIVSPTKIKTNLKKSPLKKRSSSKELPYSTDRDQIKTVKICAPHQQTYDDGENHISEEEMFSTAEQILQRLAQILIQNNSTPFEVFTQPSQIIFHAFYQNKPDTAFLLKENFIGRLHSLGVSDLSELQTACLMRVLAKEDMNQAVMLDDLIKLLERFGAPKSQHLLQGQGQINEENQGEDSSCRQSQEHVAFIEMQQPVNFDIKLRMESVREESAHDEQSKIADLIHESPIEREKTDSKNLKFQIEERTKQSSSTPRSERTKNSPEFQEECSYKFKKSISALPQEEPKSTKTMSEKRKPEKKKKQMSIGERGISPDVNNILNFDNYDQITKLSKDSSSGIIPTTFQKAAIKVHKQRQRYLMLAKLFETNDGKNNSMSLTHLQASSPSPMIDQLHSSNSGSLAKSIYQARRQISVKKESELFQLFQCVFNRVTAMKILEEVNRKSFVQAIKSTNSEKKTEAKIIMEDQFIRVISNSLQKEDVDWKPSQAALHQLREQVYLSNKYEKFYNVKMLTQLMNELEQKIKKS